MSKKEKPPAVGTCPCPEAGCAEVIEVRRYAERSGRGSMFKGKFYGNCSQHGRVIDASRTASQEHVLEKGEIWGAKQWAEKVVSAPAAKPPESIPEPSKPAQEPTAEPPKGPSARPSQPAAAPARLPVRITETAPVLRLTWQGWNLWDWWPTPRS